jgi:cytochrome P450
MNFTQSMALTILQVEMDMMAALCNQSYKDGTVVTEREVAHMLTALLMAGQHTSSTSGSWALMEVAAHPDIGYVDSGDYLKLLHANVRTVRLFTRSK